jgi:hypothetical protein
MMPRTSANLPHMDRPNSAFYPAKYLTALPLALLLASCTVTPQSPSQQPDDAIQLQRTSGARYVAKVAKRIKSNIFYVVPDDAGNEAVEYEIILKRDGTILELVKRHSSGVHNWDDAVRDAIYRSEPFPSDENGRIPERIFLHSRPKD